jgi:hypothetical protein
VHPLGIEEAHLKRRHFSALGMKTLFLIGIICVALGLLSFVVTIPHAETEQFQSGGITLGVSRTEPRRFPVGVGGTLIIGGLALMLTGCRERQP